MNLIVAVDNNWGIGKDGELLYHIKEDMQYFKAMTLGKCVIMGRKTFESLPNKKPLPHRHNVILSTDPDYKVEGATVVHSMQEMKEETYKYKISDSILIGGASLYKELLPYCDQLFITKIYPDKGYEKQADSFFPDIDAGANWEWCYKSEMKYDASQHVSYEFIRYRNRFPYVYIK